MKYSPLDSLPDSLTIEEESKQELIDEVSDILEEAIELSNKLESKILEALEQVNYSDMEDKLYFLEEVQAEIHGFKGKLENGEL